jgi:hypothetical protein
MVLYFQKLHNKRVHLLYSDETQLFTLRFVRLLEKDEIVQETNQCPVKVRILKNKIVVTEITITSEAFFAMNCNIHNFNCDVMKINKYPNYLKTLKNKKIVG